jgi:ubiquinone/menaquinone biosynthesis C-methylase UbiE
VLPRIGQWISGSDAYLYLAHSIRKFWTAEALCDAMKIAGLEQVHCKPILGGIVYLHVGTKPR